MIRLVSALMFTAAGAAAGAIFSFRLKESREICRETGDLLRSTALWIRYTGMDVYELSAGLRRQSGLEELTFLKELPTRYELGEDFHVQWQKALGTQHNIPDEERMILSRLGGLLGTSDTEGQLASISALEAEVCALESRREENYLRRGKLFRSIGVLAGAMTGILVV